jgi:transcriptional regulator with XRE-family HTH domain
VQIIDRINKIIKEKRITPKELSNETGISLNKIYKWLPGKVQPKYEDAKKLEEWANSKEDVPRDGGQVIYAAGSIKLEEALDYKDKYIKLLEETREDLKQPSLKEVIAQLEDLRESLALSTALSKTVLDCLRQHRKKLEKGFDEDKILDEERKFLAANLDEILKTGT